MIENRSRILLIDDEKETRRFLRVTFASLGYAVTEASRGSEALKQIAVSEPNVIFLDLDLPDGDGLEVLRQIRNQGMQCPIFILSARGQEVDKIEALDAGADEYMLKPFSTGELLARLRAVSRRAKIEEKAPVLEAGDFYLDTARHTARLSGRFLHLTPTEYDVFKVLLRHSDTVVTRKQLLQEVWNNACLTEKSGHLLRVIISNLRDKIEPDPAQPIYILTEPGVGYRLCAPPLRVVSKPD